MSLLAELKRRNVIRVAGLYLVGAWLIVQVAGTVLPMFGAPEWIARSLVILLAIGFVPALGFAWVFELTPTGIKRDEDVDPAESSSQQAAQRMNRLIIAVLVLAVAYFAVDKFVLTPQRHAALAALAARTSEHATSKAGAARPADADNSKSIAVLPFENLSADKDNAYFADGMQDLILTKLADIGDIKVISRTSTMKYASHPDDLKTIAQQLGVATILEGSVQKAGDQVLINVQLIDAKTDSHLWAQSYTGDLKNIFGVEGEVATKVADALKAKLSPAEVQAIAQVPTHNKDALDAYLKAQYYLGDSNRTRDKGELQRAATLAERATQLDPGFVDAWDLLALAYVKYTEYGDRSHIPQAQAAARRALALNPNDAGAHMNLGFALNVMGDSAAAIAQVQEAVRLSPSDPWKLAGLGFVYDANGRFAEAEVAYRHATQLVQLAHGDNGSLDFLANNLAGVYLMQRRYSDARDTLQSAAARDPADLSTATNLTRVWQLGWGNLAAARTVLQAVPTPVATSGTLSDAWYWQDLYARDYAAALDVIAKAPAAWFTQQQYPRELYQAQAYQAQGDAAKARVSFAAARTQLESWLKATPDNADLHANLALALAGLGDNAQALNEAKHAVALKPVSKFANSRRRYLLTLAQVNARSGHTDAAVKLLDQLLAMPAGAYSSVPLLKLDPAWDPIRKEPVFVALLTKYRNAEPATASSGVTHD